MRYHTVAPHPKSQLQVGTFLAPPILSTQADLTWSSKLSPTRNLSYKAIEKCPIALKMSLRKRVEKILKECEKRIIMREINYTRLYMKQLVECNVCIERPNLS